MSYGTVIDALESRIETTPLALMEVAQGDYDVFNESHAYVVILDYAGMSAERAELGPSFYHDWQIEITLGVPFTSPKAAHDDMATLRQHVLDRIGAVPRLGLSTVVQCMVQRGQSLPDTIAFGGNNWQMETLTVNVREIAEY